MSAMDYNLLMPFIILAVTSLICIIAIAIRRSRILTGLISLAGIAAAFAANINLAGLPGLPVKIGIMFIMDNFAVFFIGLILAGAFAVTAISIGYLRLHSEKSEEFFVLILLATLGGSVLVISNHFISFFLGLETLTVSLYALIAYHHTLKSQVEAGLKYLILAAVSSAFLLFGIAIIYGVTGAMEFSMLAAANIQANSPVLLLSGLALIVVGIGFKLAVVPFHLWTPDIYQGASAPVTSFIATVSKGGMFALLLRLFNAFDIFQYPTLLVIFTIIAIASMFTGNWLALLQNNVKRILAYSSIAHLGYLLVAFIAGGKLGSQAAAFYLVAYFITTIASFGVIGILSNGEREAEEVDDFKGLYWRRPYMATIFTAMLFSLAGIPLTAGFLGKFYVVAAGVHSARWLLVIILLINSAIGLFYYLRLVVAMFSKAESSSNLKNQAVGLGGSAVITILLILLIWFGVYPAQIFDIISKSVSMIGY
jgi:NADH-quinone oxidoreductase subunit N